MAQSQCRQNYHSDCEAGVNKQINLELYASYVYTSMAFYFDRDDVALEGFYKWFKHQAEEERGHADKLMEYQNKRGGRIVLQAIVKPDNDDWQSPLAATEAALALERNVNQALLNLHAVATANVDPQFCDFLEEHFLEEQVKSIKEIGDMITNLKRVGTGLGEYMFAKDLSS